MFNCIFHINAIVGRENAVRQLASKEVSRFRWHRKDITFEID
jgi:hypothetical protein